MGCDGCVENLKEQHGQSQGDVGGPGGASAIWPGGQGL